MTRKVASDVNIAISVQDLAPDRVPLDPSGAPAPSSSAASAKPSKGDAFLGAMADTDSAPKGLVAATQAAGLVVVVLVFAWVFAYQGGTSVSSDYPDQLFNVHPIMEVVGLVYLFGQAILSYRLLPYSKPFRKAAHMVLNGVGLLFSLVGLWAVLKFHSLKGIPDFYSLHSWFGLVTLLLFTAQWLVGFYTFWYPGAPQPTRQLVLPWHAFLGLFIFILALSTAALGSLEKVTFRFIAGLDKRGPEAILVNVLGLVFFLWGALVLLTATKVDKTRPEEGYSLLR